MTDANAVYYSLGAPVRHNTEAPAFNDLRSGAPRPLSERPGLVRAVGLLRSLGRLDGSRSAAPNLIIPNASDLGDDWDRQVVALLLNQAGSRVWVGGEVVTIETETRVIDALEQLAVLGQREVVKRLNGRTAAFLRAGIGLTARESAWAVNLVVPDARATPQLVDYYLRKNEPTEFRAWAELGYGDPPTPTDNIVESLRKGSFGLLTSAWGVEVLDTAPRPDPLLHLALREFAKTPGTVLTLPTSWGEPQLVRISDREKVAQAIGFVARVIQQRYPANPVNDRSAARREAMARHRAGDTLQAIANRLNDLGYRTSSGRGSWARSTVSKLITEAGEGK